MSSYALGVRPPDARWVAMKEIWDACVSADIPAPSLVVAFFGDGPPDAQGVLVDLEDCGAAKTWRPDNPDSMREGIEVDLSKLPTDIVFIRFVNSY